MIETRRNACLSQRSGAREGISNKGSRGFSPNMELEHAPYERRLWITKLQVEPNQIWNRFYISADPASPEKKKKRTRPGRGNSYRGARPRSRNPEV